MKYESGFEVIPRSPVVFHRWEDMHPNSDSFVLIDSPNLSQKLLKVSTVCAILADGIHRGKIKLVWNGSSDDRSRHCVNVENIDGIDVVRVELNPDLFGRIAGRYGEKKIGSLDDEFIDWLTPAICIKYYEVNKPKLANV